MDPDSLVTVAERAEWWRDWISAILSLIGLGLTVWVAGEVGQVTRHFLFRVRGPAIAQSLRRKGTAFVKRLRATGGPINHTELKITAREIEGLLQSLQSKVPSDTKGRVTDTKKAFKKYRKAPTDNAAWDAYGALQGVLTYIAELQKDHSLGDPGHV